MDFRVKGKDGEYIVKNHSSILQYKIDVNGEHTGESILHIITDSIENSDDRVEISERLREQHVAIYV